MPVSARILTLSRSPAPREPFGGTSERVDVDHGDLVGRSLDAISVVMGLDELGPVSRWPSGRRHRRWLQRLPDMGEDSSDWPRIDEECDEPDIATTRTGTGGMTQSTRCTAVCAMRRPLHDGHTPRPLHEKATRKSWPQVPHRALANPKLRMPQRRYARNSSSTCVATGASPRLRSASQVSRWRAMIL